jgi:5-methylcytosine-specific restriction endonuclease McrA
MPGWKGSNRKSTLPVGWPAIQIRILKRDHHACQHVREDTGRRCGLRATDVDHIIPNSQGGSDADSNLQALCTWHHRRKSGREGGLASGQARTARAEAAKPLHPGLIGNTAEQPPEEPAPF